MPVVSACVPMANTPPKVKTKSINELLDALNRVPSNFILVLEDFNARVGRSEVDSDMWRKVQEGHGLGSWGEVSDVLCCSQPHQHEHLMYTCFEKRQVQLVAVWHRVAGGGVPPSNKCTAV